MININSDDKNLNFFFSLNLLDIFFMFFTEKNSLVFILFLASIYATLID